MNETEWLTCVRPDVMWDFLTTTVRLTRGKQGHRPLRVNASRLL